ncbi:hypothetical protein EDB89DRAFT_1911964 [Lactarius sanguifluus]|nr:hypothetical protein EDB89DRAFT_1911964 [Lactarius sanguifluus]
MVVVQAYMVVVMVDRKQLTWCGQRQDSGDNNDNNALDDATATMERRPSTMMADASNSKTAAATTTPWTRRQQWSDAHQPVQLWQWGDIDRHQQRQQDAAADNDNDNDDVARRQAAPTTAPWRTTTWIAGSNTASY